MVPTPYQLKTHYILNKQYRIVWYDLDNSSKLNLLFGFYLKNYLYRQRIKSNKTIRFMVPTYHQLPFYKTHCAV